MFICLHVCKNYSNTCIGTFSSGFNNDIKTIGQLFRLNKQYRSVMSFKRLSQQSGIFMAIITSNVRNVHRWLKHCRREVSSLLVSCSDKSALVFHGATLSSAIVFGFG
jgi:hypothetical protein